MAAEIFARAVGAARREGLDGFGPAVLADVARHERGAVITRIRVGVGGLGGDGGEFGHLLSGDQHVEDLAERVDVGERRDRGARDAFWGGIAWRQTELAERRLRRGRIAVALGAGDAEIDELGDTVGGDEDVAGGEVAVDDQILVGEFDSVADLQHQVDALGKRRVRRFEPAAQADAINEFHDEIGCAARQFAAVVELRDVWMMEAREDAPFAPKTLDELRRGKARLDDLDGGDEVEVAVGAFCEINTAHAAAAEQADDPVGTDAVGDCLLFRVVCAESGGAASAERAARAAFGCEKGERAGADAGLDAGGVLDERPGVAAALCKRGLEQLHRGPLDQGIGMTRHTSDRRSCNQARVETQRRLTVASERPSTSAMSASDMPPK